MTVLKQKATIIGTKGRREVEMIVDSGASRSSIAREIAESVGMSDISKAAEESEVTLADGRKVKGRIYIGEVEINGAKTYASFISSDEIVYNVLGAEVLQLLKAKIDFEREKIVVEGG